jgi:hypothetical protein
VPIIVERSMYLSVAQDRVFDAGHNSIGISTPATDWFFAEGATGSFFDMFLLIANPTETAAHVEARYLLPDGDVLVKQYRVEANSRFNIWVDLEDPRLADTALAVTLVSTNGTPIVAERAMWWFHPGGYWHEANNSPGATETGAAWALAEGEVGGASATATYVLVANTSSRAGSILVTVALEDGTTAVQQFELGATSRLSIDMGTEFPIVRGRRFATLVESQGTQPVEIVVERSMYWDANGVWWAAGTNALAVKLR